MEIKSILGPVRLEGTLGKWRVEASGFMPAPGVEEICLKFSAPEAASPPHVILKWDTPQTDMYSRWHPTCRFSRSIPPDWGAPAESSLAVSAPVMQLINLKGENRVLAALSEAMRQVRLKCGVHEETCGIAFSAELFSQPESPIRTYEIILRFDTRSVFYADALRETFEWYAGFPEYKPMPVPEAAFDPVYSTWYSFHQDIFAGELEKECACAQQYGLKSIIVDDGWQTDDNNRGYAFCGDWEVSQKRFPDMRAHVEKIHKLGMKYIVWLGMSTIGEKSKNYGRFKSKLIASRPERGTGFLDPRFPDVREFLISKLEKALKEWDIDGFKLDFIDNFRFTGEDPAVKENYAGRDIPALPEAVDRLLSDAMRRLKAVKPDILIEFRQNYIGPAVRKYGNMFRSADCPGDIAGNRVNTIDLRLSSGNTAVHSDMLEWNSADTPENGALQFLNILFSVPQISVRLEHLPEAHRRMLLFWLKFHQAHREVLLHGYLKPYHPELNYPVVSAENAQEQIIAVYSGGQCAKVSARQGQCCFVINACGYGELLLDLPCAPAAAECFDTMGDCCSTPVLQGGLVRVVVPPSGGIKLQF